MQLDSMPWNSLLHHLLWYAAVMNIIMQGVGATTTVSGQVRFGERFAIAFLRWTRTQD